MRKKYLLIDTETTNGLQNPLFYDISGLIVDNYGTIYSSFALINSDIFFNSELMDTAYYKSKRFEYLRRIELGEYRVLNGYNCRQYILSIMREHSVKTVLAFNADFDRRSTNNTFYYQTNGRYKNFFPYGTKFECIMNMAVQIIGRKVSFFNFCVSNNLLSPSKKYISTTAETFFRYIKKDTTIDEKHFGIDDCRIEYQIFLTAKKAKKKMNCEINRGCAQQLTKYHKQKERQF